MTVLTGAVALVGALCLLDLLLTLGVIRRLREQATMLTLPRLTAEPGIGLGAGQAPAPFSVTGADGTAVTGPAGLRVVAFFSTTCQACPAGVRAFIGYLRAHPVDEAEVLVVVTGEGADSAPYLADLAEVGHVHAEPTDGPLSEAFAVRMVPAFFTLDAAGTVVATSYDPAALPTPAAT